MRTIANADFVKPAMMFPDRVCFKDIDSKPSLVREAFLQSAKGSLPAVAPTANHARRAVSSLYLCLQTHAGQGKGGGEGGRGGGRGQTNLEGSCGVLPHLCRQSHQAAADLVRRVVNPVAQQLLALRHIILQHLAAESPQHRQGGPAQPRPHPRGLESLQTHRLPRIMLYAAE